MESDAVDAAVFVFGDTTPCSSGRVIVETTNHGMTISVESDDDKQRKPMFDMIRDHWGVWIEMFGGCMMQEDKTRSFFDAVIKALEFARRIEVGTLPATQEKKEQE